MKTKEERNLDLFIIGAGPAGLTAAIYAARAKMDAIVLEDELIGGQVRSSYSIENYPGFEKIEGLELSEKMHNQALNLGAEIDEFDKIESIKLGNDEKVIETINKIYKPKTVIVATGARPRPLPVPEEEKLHGKSIHYCELCDGALYKDKKLVVVGGGNSALEGALFLTKFASSITMIHQFDYFQGEKTSQEEVLNHKSIDIIWDSEIRNVEGEDKIENIVIENIKTGEKSSIKADGIFVYIGYIPKTDIFKPYLNLNKWGYIEGNENMETNVRGVFVAGDVRSKTFRQITTAVSDGTIAALMCEKYLKSQMKLFV